MENSAVNPTEKIHFKDKVSHVLKVIYKALTNRTFLYIVRRILSSIITLVLIVAIVTALIRLLPDNKFYDVREYKLLRGKLGVEGAERWKNRQLFLAGRTDVNGNTTSVLQNIITYIYWIIPIPKAIPFKYDSTYSSVLEYINVFSYFGRSANYSGKPLVTDLFTSKIGISFTISILTTVFAYLLSIPLGIAMAKKPGGIADKIGNVFIVLNYAIPALVFYLLMLNVFGNPNGIFSWANFGLKYDADNPWTLFPPIFCVVFLSIPGIAIWVRRFMVDELSSDYVKFARSKGLSETKIMYKHVFRNASVPLIRGLPAIFLGSIVGSYYIEYIWTIPGTGGLLVNALQGGSPDIQLVQALTVIYAVISMSSFLLGDIITIFFDPRIKLIAD